MLPSVRRVVVSAACAAQGQGCLPKAAAASVAGASLVVSNQSIRHQRRYSSSSSKPSSKPSPRRPARQPVQASSKTAHISSLAKSPANSPAGAQPPPGAGSSPPAAGAGAGAGNGGSDKPWPRKAKQPKLPSVPSTQNIPSDFLSLSAFFSMHRPISVTQSLPRSISVEAFKSIFAVKPTGSRRSQRISDTIASLAQSVDNLEGPIAQIVVDEDDGGLNYASGNHARVYFDLTNTPSPQFLPFHPPPVPVPQEPLVSGREGDASAAAAESLVDAEPGMDMERRDHVPSSHKYHAMVTIEQSTDADGRISTTLHSARFLKDGEAMPRTFFGSNALRMLRYRAHTASVIRRIIRAISVKRQKKLKMKKKKYKKLQRRLRLENRKLDKK